MIVIAECLSDNVFVRAEPASVVLQATIGSVSVVAVRAEILVSVNQSLTLVKSDRSTLVIGRVPVAVVSTGPMPPPLPNAATTWNSWYNTLTAGVIPSPSGTMLVLDTLATPGVVTYTMNTTLPPMANIKLYMNGVITDFVHDGVTLTITGYSPGDIAGDDELKAYY
jgi:hypothetical protein